MWPYVEVGLLHMQSVKMRSHWSRVGLIMKYSCPSEKRRHSHWATDAEKRAHVLKKAEIRVIPSAAMGATRSRRGCKDSPWEHAE